MDCICVMPHSTDGDHKTHTICQYPAENGLLCISLAFQGLAGEGGYALHHNTGGLECICKRKLSRDSAPSRPFSFLGPSI